MGAPGNDGNGDAGHSAVGRCWQTRRTGSAETSVSTETPQGKCRSLHINGILAPPGKIAPQIVPEPGRAVGELPEALTVGLEVHVGVELVAHENSPTVLVA